MTTQNLTYLSKVIRARHSERVSFDPKRYEGQQNARLRW
jgi:hypothetical protein